MCGLCAAHNSFNLHCDTSNESINHHGHHHPNLGDEQNNRIDEVLPSDVEIAHNSQNKPDFSIDQAAAQITRGNTKWNDGAGGNQLGTAGTVTYSFSANPDSGNSIVTSQMMAVTEQAIKAIEAVANISFTRVGSGLSDNADINIEGTSGGGGYASWGYYRGSGSNLNEFSGATVALGTSAGYSEDTSYGMTVALHEVAHALGLSHPGNYNGSGATNYTSQAEYFQDSRQFSVMSYWSESNTGADFFARAWTGNSYEWVGGYSTNLMLHDIAALQRLYGANTTTRTGDTIYGFNSNTGDSTWTLDNAADSIIAAVWDAGGIDTLDLSGFYEDADVDLREEAFSSFGGLKWNFSIAKGAVIENATGGFGNDTILGNSAANTLLGMQGNDTLNGAGGNDWLDGGAGSDELQGGAGNDTIVYDAADNLSNVNGGSGIDTLLFDAVRLSIDLLSYGFEQSALRLIDAATELWSEIIEYYNLNDELIERHTEFDNGTSEIRVFDVAESESWTEWIREYDANGNLTSEDFISALEQIFGDQNNNTLNGTSANEQIFGYAGNDILNGGAGADNLIGGTGNDTYYVDNAGDSVVEEAGGGIDTVNASVGFALRSHNQYLENLILSGNANLQGVGNGLNNTITGNSGNNILNGAWGNDTLIGGAGNDTFQDDFGQDTMIGGTGNDTYYVDNAGDSVVEEAGGGIDTVNASVGFALRSHNQYLENLILTGNANLQGVGNGLNNTITGNSGNNILNGAWGNDTLIGGAGNDTFQDDFGQDTMIGGTGNDTYYVDNAGDSVVEEAGGGIDTVNASVGFALRSHNQHLENLILTGNANLQGVGNGLNNTITGNSGDNILNGAWGNDTLIGGAGNDTFQDDAGNDTFTGGSGSDQFIFEEDFGNDTIADFDVATLNEVINLSALSSITSYNDLVANHLGNDGFGNAVITDGENSITLTGVSQSDLSSDDFIFS